MADFKGGDVVVVPMPVSPEMVLWALPGPVGDIPYADVENLVDAEFGERIGTMTQLESDTKAHASAAAGSAGAAASSATAADTSASAAASSASTASTRAGEAATYRDAAYTHSQDASTHSTTAGNYAADAETWATSFDLTVGSTTTAAPGSSASVTVTGSGPEHTLSFNIPQGVKGDQGEVSQAQLDAAVASLVDSSPGALDTLGELAAALGNDPNFATTVTNQIAGKANASHTHTKAQVGLGNVDNTSDAAKPVSTATATALSGKVDTTDSRLTNARTPTTHTHPVTDLTATGTRSTSTYLRGDGTWTVPPNNTYTVPTQAEAEAGTATAARAFSAQRVRQAADAAIADSEWFGTQAQFDAITTKDPNRTYNILEG